MSAERAKDTGKVLLVKPKKNLATVQIPFQKDFAGTSFPRDGALGSPVPTEISDYIIISQFDAGDLRAVIGRVE